MHIALRLVLSITLLLGSVVLPIYGASAETSSRACEQLFRKEKFLNPSVRITETGRIETRITNSDSTVGRFLNSFTRFFYRPLSLDKIEEVSSRLAADGRNSPFWEKLADAFQLDIQIDPRALEKIPRTGALIIAANHPMNGVEGVALAALISKVRPDVKVVLTQLLEVLPGIAENAVFANPYGGKNARVENSVNLKLMVQHLEAGHALVIFPTGTVSGKTRLSDSEAVDGRWRTGLAHLVRKVPQTKVQPIFVDGAPSNFFLNFTVLADKYLTKFPSARVGMGAVFHVREIANRIGKTVGLTVGDPIDGADLIGKRSLQRAMGSLRTITHALRGKRLRSTNLKTLDPNSMERALEPVAEAGDMGSIHNELRTKARVVFDMAPDIPAKRMLVYLAKGREIPETLKELGRLRELTFRGVGEGTGRARDVDEFDDDYSHLIVIDKKSGEIAGAYRVGFVDQLLDAKGATGLYTSTLFDHKIIQGKLRNSLELGRSFVAAKYQNRSFALFALFSAIGKILAENPRYRYLIGPVSISGEISKRSRDLIIAYLTRYHSADDSAAVISRTPFTIALDLPREDSLFLDSSPTPNQMSGRIEQIEKGRGNQSAMPPLIQIYTALGAKFYSFNVDQMFNTVDGFAETDLAGLSYENLEVYMRTDAAAYLEYHKRHPENR